MKTIKVSELTGAALDWAVAKCEGIGAGPRGFVVYYHEGEPAMWQPSTDWSQGGPIIEREGVNLRMHTGTDKQPIAFVWVNHTPAHREQGPHHSAPQCGATLPASWAILLKSLRS